MPTNVDHKINVLNWIRLFGSIGRFILHKIRESTNRATTTTTTTTTAMIVTTTMTTKNGSR